MTVEHGTTPWGLEPRASAPEPPPEPEWTPPRVFQRDELEALMVRFEGHVAAAARSLYTTRPTLYRMLTAHGLVPADFRRARTPSRPPAANADECCPEPDPSSCTPAADHELNPR